MRKILFAAAALALAGPAAALPFSETEVNDSLANANDIDNFFSLDNDLEIYNSTTIPHVSIFGGSESGGRDWFKFSVAANSTGYFDVDHAYGAGGRIDSYLTLYNSAGSILAQNDDNGDFRGSPGSATGLDSFIAYNFTSAGYYYIRISSCCEQGFLNHQVAGNETYQLNVSLQNHALGTGAVPEPASLALLGLGLGALAYRRRKA